MSLKSKFKAFASAYKSACEQSKDAWQNSDCSISDKIKDGMKYRFALFPSTASRIEYAVDHQTNILRDEIRELKEVLKSKEKVGS